MAQDKRSRPVGSRRCVVRHSALDWGAPECPIPVRRRLRALPPQTRCLAPPSASRSLFRPSQNTSSIRIARCVPIKHTLAERSPLRTCRRFRQVTCFCLRATLQRFFAVVHQNPRFPRAAFDPIEGLRGGIVSGFRFRVGRKEAFGTQHSAFSYGNSKAAEQQPQDPSTPLRTGC